MLLKRYDSNLIYIMAMIRPEGERFDFIRQWNSFNTDGDGRHAVLHTAGRLQLIETFKELVFIENDTDDVHLASSPSQDEFVFIERVTKAARTSENVWDELEN